MIRFFRPYFSHLHGRHYTYMCLKFQKIASESDVRDPITLLFGVVVSTTRSNSRHYICWHFVRVSVSSPNLRRVLGILTDPADTDACFIFAGTAKKCMKISNARAEALSSLIRAVFN